VSGGGQIQDHRWYLVSVYAGVEISCTPRQLNGGCIEEYCPKRASELEARYKEGGGV